jgi:TonB family protein
MPIAIGAPHVCLPDYQAESTIAGEKGTTKIAFTITDTGRTDTIHVTESSGSAALDEQAITCASRWLYRPAMRDNKPVPVPWRAEIHWSLSTGPDRVSSPTQFGIHDCTAFKPAQVEVPHGAVTTLKFIVTTDGTVTDAEVATSSGNVELDKAALKCAAGWRFNPATVNGEAKAALARENVPWTH